LLGRARSGTLLRMRQVRYALSLCVLVWNVACKSSDNAGPPSVDGAPEPRDVKAGEAAPQMETPVEDAALGTGTPDDAPLSDGAPGDEHSEPSPARDAEVDARVQEATVVLFFVDGLQPAAVRTAIGAGAVNLRLVVDGGVTAETSYATSPAARLVVPPALQPWGNATSGNVAAHTGCHLNESSDMDDIFLAARRAGIRSVFAGNDANYSVFTNADFHYAGAFSDAEVLQHGVTHLKADHARLIRLHFQRIRDFWAGPASATDPSSAYSVHLREVDGLLGQLIAALKESGVWERTYLVIASDHGMGQTAASEHPPSTPSSWRNFMAFFGPDLKKGTTIPYAELPDLAILTNRWLGLPPLSGHAATLGLARPGPTGTLLTNVFEGTPRDLAHPRYIETYLNAGSYTTAGDDYAPYRQAMLRILQ
jgi:hypothetical protein